MSSSSEHGIHKNFRGAFFVRLKMHNFCVTRSLIVRSQICFNSCFVLFLNEKDGHNHYIQPTFSRLSHVVQMDAKYMKATTLINCLMDVEFF